MTTRFIPTKGPTEKRMLVYDFSDDLDTGEALALPISVAYVTKFGTDASPSSMANGSPVLDSTLTKVLVPVQGGVDGCDYLITVSVATTNAGKSPAMPAVLCVRAS